MTLSFQREDVRGLWNEALPLLVAHWHEVAHFKDIVLDPDVERYNKAQEMGALVVHTARRDRRLVGYIAWFVGPNGHYRNSIQAVQDVIYIDPAERHGSMVLRFIKWSEWQLAEQGVEAAYHHLKARKDWSPLLERLGHQLVDLIYARRLQNGCNSGSDLGRVRHPQLDEESDAVRA